MKTGSTGTFAISWSQTEVDGCKAAPLDVLLVGATWRWSGMPVRVDGPQSHLLLQGAEGVSALRQRAARTVRRLVGAAIATNGQQQSSASSFDDGVPEQGFIVTDGHKTYALTIIDVPDTNARLLMIVGNLPPVDRDLWVVRIEIDRNNLVAGAHQTGGIICFTPGTYIATPSGPRLIQTLRPGDLILTKDNGPQQVLWSGHRRMTGARLYAMPHLRPIRFRSGALGIGRPDGDLLVSPQHRMLLKGPAALALFNTPEVLVRAEDMINDISITVDRSPREVTYIHILLEQHNIVFANGLETESFHPSNTALETVDANQRDALLGLMPSVSDNPQSYGDYARRNLSSSEAAILRHDMAA